MKQMGQQLEWKLTHQTRSCLRGKEENLPPALSYSQRHPGEHLLMGDSGHYTDFKRSTGTSCNSLAKHFVGRITWM